MSAAFYADHNATTPVDPRVLERFAAVERDCPGNPGSLHGAGRAARAVLEAARGEAAAALGVPADAVVFVASGTEANNQVVAGAGDPGLPVLLSPALEHASLREPVARRGVVAWGVDPVGRAVVDAPERAVGLVALCHAQSEIGTLQPVGAAAELARHLGVPLHVDAAQTLGREPLDAVLEVADSVTLSAHKCGGLRGGSLLVVPGLARGAPLRPLLLGGGQERGLRSGTPSVALAAATARAVQLAVGERARRAGALRAVRDAFVDAVVADDANVRSITPREAGVGLCNTATLFCAGVADGRALLPALDLAGVQAAQGSACASGSPEPPPVLAALGFAADDARRCVRFSFGVHDSVAEVTAAAARVVSVLRRA